MKKDALVALVLLVAYEDHSLCLEAEGLAKAECRGLGYDEQPEPPWQRSRESREHRTHGG